MPIDPTLPADDVAAEKGDLRDNLQAAKEGIEPLVVTVTGSSVLVNAALLGDRQLAIVNCIGGTQVTVTLAADVPVGRRVRIARLGGGDAVAMAGSGATLVKPATLAAETTAAYEALELLVTRNEGSPDAAEWLLCSGTKPSELEGFFVSSVVGSPQGTGTVDDPFVGLEFAISQLSAGDTLWVRGGSYYENDVDIGLVGTADNPITIRAYPGETPILDGRIPEFLEPGGSPTNWEVHSGTVYKSIATFPTGTIAHGFFEEGGQLYKLVSYKSLAALSAANEDWAANGEVYCGPGVFYNATDDKVYIRLDIPTAAKIAGQVFTVPSTNNPNNVILHIGVHGSGVQFTNAAHVIWNGIDCHCYEQNFRFFTSSNCELRNSRVLIGQYGVITSSGSNYLLDGLDLEGWLPGWVSWTDIKTSPAPAERNKVLGWENNDTATDIEVRYCNFYACHDGFNSNGAGDNIRVHHCTFTAVQDDAGEFGVEAGFCEMAYCLVYGELIGHDSNAVVNTLGLGQKYIHHNICNARAHEVFWARSDPNTLLDASFRNFPLHTHNIIGSHGQSSSPHFDPYKIYQNTFIYGDMENSQDHHLAGWGAAPDASPADPKHEVYNNILMVDSTPALYDPHETLDGDFEEYDGNLYFKMADGSPTTHLIRFYESSSSYFTLAAFRSANPSSNFEVNGVEGNPQLADLDNDDYRPSGAGPAASGAINLTSTGWPDAGNQGFRGAVDPDSTDPFGGIGAR